MNTVKLEFLENEMISLFKKISPDTKPLWGVMNAQQMVEHFSETTRYANGKIKLPLFTDLDYLPKLRVFMLSERPFRENTKNPMLGETPAATRNASLQEAVAELESEVNHFFAAFARNENLITQNPIFGELNFEQNVHLIHKHALHHLKQFGML
ncbi:hypothetical protein FRZ67_15350 [Panacibacter ginsenosidivorans]|uniref:DUF1569 domain-containing protein n=1 Tax=Panacibacter ginsenosidivorans TaxID=1813871 RepID=A0A5B8VD94_9BACT|nr:hypothetical protein [Panacibacter ginsenosidivorans]QEC68616.1 hypothetical protein FRZ67_15350 [Panacibacter ginsenosidivorans]